MEYFLCFEGQIECLILTELENEEGKKYDI